MLPTIHIEIERWKFNNHYLMWVSNKGNFKNKNKQPIPVKMNQSGYMVVKAPSRNDYILVHRAVMSTWCPVENWENLTVDHLDHNKRHNAVSNLEWVTKEENLRRAEADLVKTCPKKKQYSYKCVTFNKTMTEEQLVIAIRALKPKFSKLSIDDIKNSIKGMPNGAFGLEWEIIEIN